MLYGTRQPLLGIPFWYHIMWSSHCYSLTYGCLIFKWIGETRLPSHWSIRTVVSVMMATRVTCPMSVNTLRPRQNGRHFHRQYFQMHFPEWKCLNFDWNFTEICSLGSNWQQSSAGSDDDLAPSRRQAIIWTNDDLFCWCIYTSLSLNESKPSCHGPASLRKKHAKIHGNTV